MFKCKKDKDTNNENKNENKEWKRENCILTSILCILNAVPSLTMLVLLIIGLTTL